jgi:hypothetical protein
VANLTMLPLPQREILGAAQPAGFAESLAELPTAPS